MHATLRRSCYAAILATYASADAQAGCGQRYDYQSADYRIVCERASDFDSKKDLGLRDRLRNRDAQDDFYQGDNRKGFSADFASGEICSGRGLDRFCMGGDGTSAPRRLSCGGRAGCR